jgi:heme exporter protein A
MLEIADLECARGGRTLFRGRSFSLRGGELLHVAGANGSGKTSLLRILCGLLPPERGEVRWQGTPIRRLREDYSKQLVFIGHAAALKDDLTAGENLRVACTLAGAAASDAAIEDALKKFGVEKASLVKQLSQGQRRRAALARLALSASVPLWLLDEPFAALDAAAARLAGDLIATHIARGGMAVYTTHQEAPIEASARVLSLDGPAA